MRTKRDITRARSARLNRERQAKYRATPQGQAAEALKAARRRERLAETAAIIFD
jgi:hypothetical protein